MLAVSEITRFLSRPLAKRVDQKAIENWSASLWQHIDQRNVLSNETSDDKQRFTMMLPPPNVTGNLHLGHALTVAVQDALIRNRQMHGYHVDWIPGFDHAGLATQRIIDQLLWHKNRKTRQEITRDEFISLANSWKDLKKVEMKAQLSRMGLKLNYEREFFTTDDRSSFSVRTAFKRLFNQGLIYRATRDVFWSSKLGTTLSDIEVTELDGVKTYERTGEVVETRSIPQWFVDCRDMAQRAVLKVNDGSIEMIPTNYKRTWSDWLLGHGVHDWCISRQSWWGHTIPAFKKKSDEDVSKNWVVADTVAEACQKLNCHECDIEQDKDVLDTWFSSALLPLSISNWPDEQEFAKSRKDRAFPLDIMETGFDILTHWVAKMVMMSLALENAIPFKMVLLHGMICDSKGKKMSKSKGNVIDPSDVIDGASLEELQDRARDSYSRGLFSLDALNAVLENQRKLFPSGIPECGADGLRAYLLSQDFQEEIFSVQISQIAKVRRLMNKVWNVYRYLISLIESSANIVGVSDIDINMKELSQSKLDEQDCILLSNLARCVELSQLAFHVHYQLHVSFTNLENFIDKHLSSEYITETKMHFTNNDPEHGLEIKQIKLRILIKCLVTYNKLLHPFMPHLTEFLHQKLLYTLVKKELHATDPGINEFIPLAHTRFPLTEDWVHYRKKIEEP